MKKSKFKHGALVLFAALAFSLFLPMYVNAQGGGADGFFKGFFDDYENRDGEDVEVYGGVTNDSFNAPIGSGLLIMLASGLGYAAVKRRGVRSRDCATMLVASALMLGMTQCKKEVNKKIPYNNKVNITLNLDDGAKTDVNPETGTVDFVDGDEIIVANNGVYVGTLVYEDDVFSGTIIGASSDDYLHFYHLGNKDVGLLVEGSSSACSVSISDQITTLPVISAGCSNELYSDDNSSYTARLHNKCALVMFDVDTDSEFAATCISGCKNQIDVDFSDDSFSFSEADGGKIHLSPGRGCRWAVLLPQEELGEGEAGSAVAGIYSGTRGAVPKITANEVYADGVSVVMNEAETVEGALNAFFTVNEQGKKVRFSKANLSYNTVTKEWRFLDYQYSVEERDSEGVGDNYEYRTVMTLFGWSTSGFNHGAVCYMPYSTSTTKSSYCAYGNGALNLYDGDGTADWGYNKIANGGGAYKQWRVLTQPEWYYLITRAQDEEKFAEATINTPRKSITGFVLLPDEWSEPYSECFTAGYGNNYTTNVYTLEQWQQMEENGALFLPNCGRRYKKVCTGPNLYLFLWTSSRSTNSDACAVFLSNTEINPLRTDYKSCGSAVRLVCE